jgi:two-component system sensor histidine kinase AgrC
MEILQTIWNALIIENQMLIKITSMPMFILELTISMLLFTTILNINVTKKQKILYVLILALIGIFTLWIIPAPFNTFINLIACPIFVYFIFKTTILKSILSEIIQFIIFTILGLIITNIYIVISNMPNSAFINIPIYKISCSLSVYLLAYILYKYLKHFNIKIVISDKINTKKHMVLLLNLIIGIIAICIQSYIATLYTNYIPFGMTLSTILILLIYFFISMYSLSRTNKLEITTEKLEEEKLYNKTITILYDNIRGFKHDFNNIVQAIGGYISTENIEGLKDYYSDLMVDCQKVNNLAILNPELINNPAVYSLLTSKYHKAEELGIKMNFEIFLDLKTLNIKIYDLTRILGILLDNSIEAASKCDEKEINITIRKDNKANRQLFIIENTYLNKDVNTDRIFEKGYTSKTEKDKKNHGLGLWEVRQILKKNNNLNLYTTKDTKLFKQQLEIYL